MKPEWIEVRSRYLQTRNIIWAHQIRKAELKAGVLYGVAVGCGFFLLTNFLTPLPDVLNGWLSLVGFLTALAGAIIVIEAREVPPRIRSWNK